MADTNQSSNSDRPRILICNDDGIDAPGIQALASALDGLGDLIIAAPESEQSAVGHAITVRDPVRAQSYGFEVPSGPTKAWSIAGTPADCIKLAGQELLDRPPDLVVSGINHGPNTAVNVLYSGTVSAATEAAIMGYPAIAFSLCSWSSNEFEAAGYYARMLSRHVLNEGLPAGSLLNVNIPALPFDEIAGVRITRQARARWEESFVARTDPLDRPYYWLSGTFVNLDSGADNDLAAIEDDYVAVTPMQLDLTAHEQLEGLRSVNWDEKLDRDARADARAHIAARRKGEGPSE
ncbi:MAG: 5'/3'-nucleotidase SurE [Longimonas sp.]|uniref:5'/3'-nucleotidase SurE n=1 Tax=Longimonas sp. TaxID=2039626 RepID=UPI00335CA159